MSTATNPNASPKLETITAVELIRLAAQKPPELVIEGLMNVGDILLLHGAEDSFKSVLFLQIAESIATATPLLRCWNVPQQSVVGIVETELHPVMLGQRLAKMFSTSSAPAEIRFMGADVMHQFRRVNDLAGKFKLLSQWVAQENIEVLLIDTANDFFRGRNNPSEETVVGCFFDALRNLPVKATGMVRHDRKRKGDDALADSSNEQIRGSAEWKEDPEVILHLARQDRRTNKVQFEVGKLRYGSKPEPLSVWFDAGCFRLIPLPPVIAVLETGPKSRQDVLTECKVRFGLSERKVDEMLGEHKPFLRENQQGHQKVFEIDWDRAVGARWFSFARRH